MNYKRNLQYVYMLPDEPVDLREAEKECQANGWELASFNQDNTSLDVDFITAQNFIKDKCRADWTTTGTSTETRKFVTTRKLGNEKLILARDLAPCTSPDRLCSILSEVTGC